LAAAAHTATAASCAARSAYKANERQNRQNRQNGGIGGILSDGSDGSDGEKHTQTNAGHRGERDVAESSGTCSHCLGPVRLDAAVKTNNGAVLHHRCVDAWVRQAPAPQPARSRSLPANLEVASKTVTRRAEAKERPSPASWWDTPGRRIRTARERLGWSQQRLAREAGTYQGAISNLEYDKRVNAEVRARVLAALGLENSN
jgi:DNA-binding XRE family transcriptional regulator